MRVWTATDDCGNSVAATQRVAVADTTAPALVGVPADATAECDDVPAPATVTATDSCDGDVPVAFGVTTNAGSCADSYTLVRVWTATDDCGNSVAATQRVAVADTTDPVLTIPADETVECDVVPAVGTATATDNCDADVTVTYDGEVRTDGACAYSYTLTRTWTATDNCGNSTTNNQTVSVQDTSKPVLTIPADETVECNAVPVVGTATATDNCDPYVTVTYDGEVFAEGACAESYTLTRTWTATDRCGNNTTLSQTITVQDTAKPVVDCPADLTIWGDSSCMAQIPLIAVIASDNCTATGDLQFDQDPAAGTPVAGPSTNSVTIIVTDHCGNSSTCTVQVIVLCPESQIGNFVWDDLNGNGIQDAGEPGIGGMVVILYDVNSNVVATTVTDGNGFYSLTANIPGTYVVGVVPPSGYQFTLADQGADDGLDSDIDPTLGITMPFVLPSGTTNLTIDAGLYGLASIGDYVWLDENWDGVQDPGEQGIPNVRIELLDGGGNVIASTMTDLNGLYLFAGLLPAPYTVRVDTASLAPELAANQTYDPDHTIDNQFSVTLGSGSNFVGADFGYNWSPDIPSLGAIGDRVWVDADGDGVQDLGEPGIPSVTVRLLVDAAGNGNYTTEAATATTDAAGLYQFASLPAGTYAVQIDTATLPADYMQTGDPDYFGTLLPAGEDDHRTTVPVLLAPGDVFVNADFGYQFPTGSAIGDQIYFDANANGAFDGADYGIPGVTVVLLDSASNVVASTVTDAIGNYLFTGLPAGTFTVWVNDSGNLLAELNQSSGGSGGHSTTTVDGTNDDLDQDFGYTAQGHDSDSGLIGDTVFLDRNGNNTADPGEGIQGATVYLYDGTGTTLVGIMATDPNGHYYFGGLDAGTYLVRVDTNTLPSGGADLVNSVDPDGGADSGSSVVLDLGEIDLGQDFGYVAATPNTIAGTLWNDLNADGVLDADETARFAGVTIQLRDSLGNLLGTATTDANGDYAFAGLPDGSYVIDVVDTGNVLNGWWHSLGPNPGADGNSQAEPYFTVVNGGETNRTADFGYYLSLAELGDYVWIDKNGNGLQDAGEIGVSNVLVTLNIEYPSGTNLTMRTLTDGVGRYRFANLLLSEQFQQSTTNNPLGGNSPRFQVSVDSNQLAIVVKDLNPTIIDAGDGTNDSRNHQGVYVALRKGGIAIIYDFGFEGAPLLAVIGNVEAFTRDGQTVVRWETLASWGTAGFYLERQIDGQWTRISAELVPFPLFGEGTIVYEETDPGAAAGGTYLWRLVELETSGKAITYGPYRLTVDGAGRTYADWAAARFAPDDLADAAVSGPEADPDGDGLNNRQEFLAGTDPWDADSVLQITGIARTDEGLELRWHGVAGRRYRIAVAESLFGPFLPLEQAIEATDENGRAVLTTDFQNRRLYFRVILVGTPE